MQETRFVRAMQRCYTAVLRNLPTLASVIGEAYKLEVLRFNNTKAKEYLTILNNLRCGESLFFAIGLSQLLENYCLASLESQYSDHFPIQVWRRIELAKEELSKWKNQWTWNDTPLKVA